MNPVLEAAKELQPVIRDCQEEIERERRVPPAIVEQCREAGLYRLLVPRELGGAQVDTLTFGRAIELIAEADGSVAWNLGTSSANSLTALSFPDEGVREVFADGPDVVFAGTIAPTAGRGLAVDGGYVVDGRWPFGSGCQNSQWMTGTFTAFDGDRPRQNVDGSPVLMRGLFHAEECEIIDTWDTTGLRGTGSHDWTVKEVFVPERRTTRYPGQPTTNAWRRWSGTLYQMPGAAVLSGSQFSVVATGIARAAIDALVELAGGKVPRTQSRLLRDDPQAQEAVGRAEAILGAGQAFRAAVAKEIWDTASAGKCVTVEQLARHRLGTTMATDCAMQAVDLMYRAGGTTSIDSSQRIARCWRDVHVVGQNTTLLPEYYLLAGRAFLGLDPGPKIAEPGAAQSPDFA
jgi:alkylation response protein AidB-like acyl-CoA dehydrogenase